MHLLSLLILPMMSLAFFFFFARGYWSVMILFVLIAPPMALMSASVLPLVNSVFSKERFGQFCSAQAVLAAVMMMMGGSYLSGRFVDAAKGYRFLYAWMSGCQGLSALCMLGAYLLWRRASVSCSV